MPSLVRPREGRLARRVADRGPVREFLAFVLAGELYGAERLSAACIGRDEGRFRRALAPVSEGLVAA